MKILIATGLACALVATSMAPAAAAATARYVTQRHSAVSLVGDRRSSWRSDRDWDSDQSPVGSSSWWQQMDRDQRGGRR
jgi:Ni/Co efflux regulator RcnB